MAERGVAVLAAAASTVGAATIINATVVGFIQLLLWLQKQHVEEDEWAIARVRRVRDTRRAVRLQRRRHRVQPYIAPWPYRRFRWELALWADVRV